MQTDTQAAIDALQLPGPPGAVGNKLPEILNQQMVSSELFKIEQLSLRFSNGEQRRYERLKGRVVGAVIVVAMLDNDHCILISEYACGLHSYELGLPKGRLEEGEDILTGANRELMEETGFGAHDLREITALSLAPGYMTHRTHIVLAQNLYARKLPGDEPETIQVFRWPMARLDELAQRPDCSEGRTIAALYLVNDIMKENNNG